eukprot:CAMPEP_0184866232 /NCGR_PEP_ID=MMETSP0580-20130426/21462_1 /TAXON_ID=1118495 /ORGANISM="Dactyliosolen fragilissimus" /LENGTH=330 /DNA_ID=CAMNT_0027365799 /DNA_START=172 /DNA_END=1164 /DNA_ORIENTATION=-
MARYNCAGLTCAIFALWCKYTFVPESQTPGVDIPMHSYHTPLYLTVGYLISLPLLKYFVVNVLSKSCDVKLLLKESMIVYNVGQVILNGWMVWRFIDAVVNKGHPFIGDIHTTTSGTSYAIWVHYCDKYLEFFDTYFMILRGRMDQVSFLHVYHHFSIAWAWWAAITLFPGGDSYFGALLNSLIHVLMYGYYALSLLKVPCPWKRYLTQAQLLQFTSVVFYSFFSITSWPKEDHKAKHTISFVIQLWEMVSLFVLFSVFYRKSYGKKNKNKTAKQESMDDDDQCQQAVVAGVQAVENAAIDAAKNASKAYKASSELKKTARNTIRRNVVG